MYLEQLVLFAMSYAIALCVFKFIFWGLVKFKPNLFTPIEKKTERWRQKFLLRVVSFIIVALLIIAAYLIFNLGFFVIGAISGFALCLGDIFLWKKPKDANKVNVIVKIAMTFCVSLVFLITITGIFFIQRSLITYNDRLPTEIKEIVLANRTTVDADYENLFNAFNELLYQYDDFDAEPEVRVHTDKEQVTEITVDEALEDVDYFFGIVKYGYGAYQYFGGDEVFLDAKEAVKKEVQTYGETILTRELSGILAEQLSFIQDGHFRIGSKQLFQRYNYYYSEMHSFFRDEQGFYTIIDEEKYYLTRVNGASAEEYMRASLDENGELVYFLGQLYPSVNREQTIEVELEADNDIISGEIVLSFANPIRDFGVGSIYSLKEVEGIPIVQIRSMFPGTEAQVTLMSDFVSDARDLRNEDIFIIDVRGNRGGSDSYPNDWIYNYSGVRPSTGRVGSHLHTNTSMEASKRFIESITDPQHKQNVLENIEHIVSQDYFPGWSSIFYNPQRQIRNPNLILVFTDRNVASSGESYIRMLSQMDNVIFVGENTAGISLVGNNNDYVLPNSQIALRFGATLILNPDLTDDEGIGFLPDIWVSPEETLERSLLFIENYFR